jgi:hypothetical protein
MPLLWQEAHEATRPVWFIFQTEKLPALKLWQKSHCAAGVRDRGLVWMWPEICPVAKVPLWQFVQVCGCTPALT